MRADEYGVAIDCAFNPKSYVVSKTNVWNFKPTTGVDLPKGEFGGGLPRRLPLFTRRNKTAIVARPPVVVRLDLHERLAAERTLEVEGQPSDGLRRAGLGY